MCLSPITLPINFCNHIIFNHCVCVCVCVCESFQHLYFYICLISYLILIHDSNHTLNFPFLLNATQLTANCKGMRQQYTLDDIKKKLIMYVPFLLCQQEVTVTLLLETAYVTQVYCNWPFHLTLQDMPKNETTWQSCVLKPCVVQCTSKPSTKIYARPMSPTHRTGKLWGNKISA